MIVDQFVAEWGKKSLTEGKKNKENRDIKKESGIGNILIPMPAKTHSLDCPAASIEGHQRNRDNHGAKIQFTPFTRENTADYQ